MDDIVAMSILLQVMIIRWHNTWGSHLGQFDGNEIRFIIIHYYSLSINNGFFVFLFHPPKYRTKSLLLHRSLEAN